MTCRHISVGIEKQAHHFFFFFKILSLKSLRTYLYTLVTDSIFMFFSSPWACPMQIGLSQECCSTWSPHSSPRTFLWHSFVLFLQVFLFLEEISFSCLLATTILPEINNLARGCYFPTKSTEWEVWKLLTRANQHNLNSALVKTLGSFHPG